MSHSTIYDLENGVETGPDVLRSARRGSQMQAYILETGRRIAPFDEPPGELRIHNRPLRRIQE
ncbi:MAG TPA: hypothetical protein VGX76_05420, partial [Pirellulales bacterium]|nr:hypothetical protein [Pirellulales bacterium]